MPKRRVVIYLLVGLVGTSCGEVKIPWLSAAPVKCQRLTVVELFDVSRSVPKKARERYAQDAQLVLDRVSEGGKLFGDIIGRNTLAGSYVPLQKQFECFDPAKHNRDRFATQKEAKLDRARRVIDEIVSIKPRTWGTDLLSGFDVASRILAAEGQGDKVLLVFSDMIHVSNEFDLRQISRRRPSHRQVLAKLARRGLPDLRGVTVHIVGAGGNRKLGMSVPQMHIVEEFWRAYIEQSGGVIAPGGYGTRLLGF